MKKRKFEEDDGLKALVLRYLHSHEYDRSAETFSKESGCSQPSSGSINIEDLFSRKSTQEQSTEEGRNRITTHQQSIEEDRSFESQSERRRSKSSSPFKRVDADVWMKEVKTGLHNNSYEETFGMDGYGAKANKVLSAVKGKDFRHEKTKRKRSTYRGGQISLESKSFKYSDD